MTDSSEKRLRQAVELVHGEGTPLALETLPGPWATYAYGRLNGLQGIAASEPTRQAFAEAEKREPRLVRARWQVVLEALARNDRRGALSLAEDLLTTHGEHGKARGLVSELRAAPPTPAITSPASAPAWPPG